MKLRAHLTSKIFWFGVTMWGVVLCSFAAIVTKAWIGKPSTVPVHYLLGSAVIAALLAILVPSFESYVFSKIRKISLGGVEMELAGSGSALDWLAYKQVAAPSQLRHRRLPDVPFSVLVLSGPMLYLYERLSYRLYQAFDSIADPNLLDLIRKENYRKHIQYVCEMAIAMKHYTKALDIVLQLEYLRDRPLNSEEQLLMGIAHLWAADELEAQQDKVVYWEKARPLLKAAMDGNTFDAKAAYNLGYALFCLGQYDEGITASEQAMARDRTIEPWARWNIACGLMKKGQAVEVIEMLKKIPAGPWWEGIAADDWFNDLRATPQNAEFETLCRDRRP